MVGRFERGDRDGSQEITEDGVRLSKALLFIIGLRPDPKVRIISKDDNTTGKMLSVARENLKHGPDAYASGKLDGTNSISVSGVVIEFVTEEPVALPMCGDRE